MKIAIFFLLPLAADGSKCRGGKEPVQNKTISINTTFCSNTELGKAFRGKYTQGAEKCCDLKYACLQICGINKKKCQKFGILDGKSPDPDCDPTKRCKNEQGDKTAACKSDFRDLQWKARNSFKNQRACTCAKTEDDVPNLREKVLNDFDDVNCLMNKTVNYKDNTEVAKWFLKIIKKKVIGTYVCADHERMRAMAVEIDSDSSTVLANQ